MKEMSARLATDVDLAERYAAAHEDYLERRSQLGQVPEIEGISAGGMPSRVKCLHVLVGHSLAAGPGVNPLGDEALVTLPEWWCRRILLRLGRIRRRRRLMTRVAAVDCGTNSIRLLVADIDSRGRLVDVCREGEVVRLGHGWTRPA